MQGQAESLFRSQCHIEERASDVKFDFGALLPEADMDRIFRYEEKVQRQMDWALQRLEEAQERRRTLPAEL